MGVSEWTGGLAKLPDSKPSYKAYQETHFRSIQGLKSLSTALGHCHPVIYPFPPLKAGVRNSRTDEENLHLAVRGRYIEQITFLREGGEGRR